MIVTFLTIILFITSLSAEIPSSADWSNAVWQLIQDHDKAQGDTIQLELPSDSKGTSPKQKIAFSLKEVIKISKQILGKLDLKVEEKLKIALFLIDIAHNYQRVEEGHGQLCSDLIEYGKSYLNNDVESPKIEVAYAHQLQDGRNILQTDLLTSLISDMLMQAGYKHKCAEIKIDASQTHKIVILETSKGKKFIKIHTRGGGLNEYLGTCAFKDQNLEVPQISIIPTETLIISQNVELVIQPLIPTACLEGGLLFDTICRMEFEPKPEDVELIKLIFSDSLQLSKSTMQFSSFEPARNDDLFFDRLKTQKQDRVSGRIEHIYSGKKFKLQKNEILWEKLKTLHWTIDGVAYKETLEELLSQARAELDPSKPRLLGISHGDWHENNIIVQGVNPNIGDVSPYAYIDLERSGLNDIVEDAALFLTHLTFYADYINPKYSPNLFKNNVIAAKSLEKSSVIKKREFSVSCHDSLIDMQGIDAFGTQKSRINIAKLFFNYYYKPLVEWAVLKYNIKSETFDNHFRYAILLRLIGGREITKWEPDDQMRVIGLIYQSLATPINEVNFKAFLDRFIDALEGYHQEKEFCEIDLVRHGETEWNKEGRIHGHLDIPLNATGEQQAQTLQNKLKEVPYTVFFSSDLNRAYTTASIVKGLRACDIVKSKELRERFFDIWEGRMQSEIEDWDKEHMDELRGLSKKEYLALKKSAHMESVTEVFQRVKKFIDSHAPWYFGSRIFISTHGGVLRAILESLEIDDLQRKWTIENCALLKLRYDCNGLLTLIDSEGVKFKIKQ